MLWVKNDPYGRSSVKFFENLYAVKSYLPGGAHIIHGFLGPLPHESAFHHHNVGSAIYPGLICVTNIQTDRQTDCMPKCCVETTPASSITAGDAG